MSIWKKDVTQNELNSLVKDCIEEHLDIKIVEIGNDYISATMPVDRRTRQPFGILHGGASVVLAETLGSLATTLCLDENMQYGVGIVVNANHVRQVKDGYVKGVSRPVHLGRKVHVWEIKIFDVREKLVSICRLTVAILNREKLVQ
jgi:1,4-dihydroxy-2-naphthoyl-CoA hydrolase